MPTVSISNIRKAFGDVQAVDGVSFEVNPGEIFGLLGPNGAGKTTAIRMVLDIFKPDSGEITVFDGKLDEARKNRIGYQGLCLEIKKSYIQICPGDGQMANFRTRPSGAVNR